MAAFGALQHPNLPFYGIGAGIQTELGTIIPPGGQVVAYVHSSGVAEGMPQGVADRLYTTLNSALALCRSGKGDAVIVLPGHTENFATADSLSNLVAGTRIIGTGFGTMRPTFTWSATGSTVLWNVANVMISNCILMCAGPTGSTALTVTAPMTVSAAGFTMIGCTVNTEIDANQSSVITMTTTTAADDMTIAGCHWYGLGDGTLNETMLRLIGCDRLRMYGNVFDGFPSAVGGGVVQFHTTASLNIWLESNTYISRKALSTCAVVGLAGVSGISRNESFNYLVTNTLTPWLTSTGDVLFHRPTVTNTTGETGTENVGTVSA